MFVKVSLGVGGSHWVKLLIWKLIRSQMIQSAWDWVLFSTSHLQPCSPQREAARLPTHGAAWMSSILGRGYAQCSWGRWQVARAARQSCGSSASGSVSSVQSQLYGEPNPSRASPTSQKTKQGCLLLRQPYSSGMSLFPGRFGDLLVKDKAVFSLRAKAAIVWPHGEFTCVSVRMYHSCQARWCRPVIPGLHSQRQEGLRDVW